MMLKVAEILLSLIFSVTRIFSGEARIRMTLHHCYEVVVCLSVEVCDVAGNQIPKVVHSHAQACSVCPSYLPHNPSSTCHKNSRVR
jgi:hypothetical protein